MTISHQPLAVLVTYHNEGALLTRCLASLSRQTRAVDEVWVYDDASSVRPEAFVPASVRLRVLRSDVNVGPAVARNALFRQSSAAYVHFHDADDEFEPTWCERVMEQVELHGATMVLTEATRVAETGSRHERFVGLNAAEVERDLTHFGIRHSILVPCATYHRSLVQSVGGYREVLWQSEDWDFHIRIAAQRPVVRILGDSLVLIHGRAASRSEQRHEVWLSAVQAVELLAAELSVAYRQDLSDAAARFASALYRLGDRENGARAFALADRLGPSNFPHLSALPRTIARVGGGEWAEQAAQLYRRIVPEDVRRAVRRRAPRLTE